MSPVNSRQASNRLESSRKIGPQEQGKHPTSVPHCSIPHMTENRNSHFEIESAWLKRTSFGVRLHALPESDVVTLSESGPTAGLDKEAILSNESHVPPDLRLRHAKSSAMPADGAAARCEARRARKATAVPRRGVFQLHLGSFFGVGRGDTSYLGQDFGLQALLVNLPRHRWRATDRLLWRGVVNE